ncbi:uncharacterized protein G2W53_017552 [Senna tora]|uniref:Uncharacterized protein n=1 Tax=Senna tora TaxID=362788 RepID=A0A834TQ75_9FABA|nr:uncharacterized protein G2W53_017552 [Senna tora]
MGFLTITTCYSEFHRTHNLYGIKEEAIKVLRNGPTYKPDNHLKGLLELAQPRSEGNLAYFMNFYCQAKIYGRIEGLTYQGEMLQTISPNTIQAHYNLPNAPICEYVEGRKNNSLINRQTRPSSRTLLTDETEARQVAEHQLCITQASSHAWKKRGKDDIPPSLQNANVKTSEADPIFRPLEPLNYGRLEFAEEVAEGCTQQRHSREKCTAKRIRTESDIDGLVEKMDLPLKGQEDHRKETREAFRFLYWNHLEIAEAGQP